MKLRHVLQTGIAAIVTATMLASCGSSGGGGAATPAPADTTTTVAATTTQAADTATTAAAADNATTAAVADNAPADASGAPAEGKDTNNGRPYNLTPVAYDDRQSTYLNGINATILPITPQPTTITVWRGFSSTVMQGLDECEVFKEMEKRTNIHINWIYPPVGSEQDNYNLRISSGDLPDIFSCPPAYAGGVAKAVGDDVYTDLTPYWQQGLMPNLKYLSDVRPDIAKDLVDDEGRLLFFPMIDIVGSDPWSGMWVREDWVQALGLQDPLTIADWDTMLHQMKDKYNVAPLALDFGLGGWYGPLTNYAFVGSYEAAYENFINKDGTVAFGSTEPGYKDFLTLMNKWYTDGILDPDFATRTYEDYNANISGGKIGAYGLAYGELGQIKINGMKADPNFKMQPVLQPTVTDGQTIHLHQKNATVRGDREFVTTKAVDDNLIETICKYKDYWYSQDGGDLCSYGPEGVSYEWNTDGTVKWIYPALDQPDSDFWTLYPLFKLHNWAYLRDSTSYENQPEVQQCIDLWATQPSDWLMPDNIAFTTDESTELDGIMNDIRTYVNESTLKFITGQSPISDFDKYVEQVKAMNVDRAVEINQAAIDRYNKRGS